jgi:hypothetical protein
MIEGFGRSNPSLRQGLALLAIVAVCAGAGYLASKFVLGRYEATASIILPLGGEVGTGMQMRAGEPVGVPVRMPDGPTFFRQIEPILGSSAAIEHFAENRGLTKDPVIIRFVAQARTHRTEPVSFTFSYGINRSDVRDLPDVVASEFLKQSSARFALVLLVSARTESEAGRAAKILIDYVRDTIVRIVLQDVLSQTAGYARIQVAKINNELSSIQIRLASIDDQIADLEQIRALYIAGPDTGSDIVSVPNISSQSVPNISGQSEGHRYLSPVRQLVALRAERSELTDRERVMVSRRASLDRLEAYAVAVQNRIRMERIEAAPLDIAFNALDLLRPTASAEQDLALANVRASVNELLVSLRSNFVDRPPEPEEPIVYRTGPPFIVVIGASILMGFILWLAFVRGALRGLVGTPGRSISTTK